VTRWGCAAVRFGGLTRPQQLIDGMDLHEVFTRGERIRSGAGRSIQHWAGRLAAKRAVLDLLGVTADAVHLGQVEVLPRPTALCDRSARCRHGHPPAVRLHSALIERVRHRGIEQIRLSITHAADTALAVALVGPRLPDDDPTVHPMTADLPERPAPPNAGARAVTTIGPEAS
jgi:holo-[acyl-carrier protein] synthase